MCAVCWARVPKHLQRAVFAASRARRNGARAEARGLQYDYDTAVDEAIESVR